MSEKTERKEKPQSTATPSEWEEIVSDTCELPFVEFSAPAAKNSISSINGEIIRGLYINNERVFPPSPKYQTFSSENFSSVTDGLKEVGIDLSENLQLCQILLSDQGVYKRIDLPFSSLHTYIPNIFKSLNPKPLNDLDKYKSFNLSSVGSRFDLTQEYTPDKRIFLIRREVETRLSDDATSDPHNFKFTVELQIEQSLSKPSDIVITQKLNISAILSDPELQKFCQLERFKSLSGNGTAAKLKTLSFEAIAASTAPPLAENKRESRPLTQFKSLITKTNGIARDLVDFVPKNEEHKKNLIALLQIIPEILKYPAITKFDQGKADFLRTFLLACQKILSNPYDEDGFRALRQKINQSDINGQLYTTLTDFIGRLPLISKQAGDEWSRVILEESGLQNWRSTLASPTSSQSSYTPISPKSARTPRSPNTPISSKSPETSPKPRELKHEFSLLSLFGINSPRSPAKKEIKTKVMTPPPHYSPNPNTQKPLHKHMEIDYGELNRILMTARLYLSSSIDKSSSDAGVYFHDGHAKIVEALMVAEGLKTKDKNLTAALKLLTRIYTHLVNPEFSSQKFSQLECWKAAIKIELRESKASRSVIGDIEKILNFYDFLITDFKWNTSAYKSWLQMIGIRDDSQLASSSSATSSSASSSSSSSKIENISDPQTTPLTTLLVSPVINSPILNAVPPPTAEPLRNLESREPNIKLTSIKSIT